MADNEAFVKFEIMKAWGAHPRLRLWRQNTGVGWYVNGQPARQTDPGAYPVKYGIPGQWDISGLLDDGRRIEIECKAPGKKLSEAQLRWGAMIRRFGGITIEAWALADADAGFAALGITR